MAILSVHSNHALTHTVSAVPDEQTWVLDPPGPPILVRDVEVVVRIVDGSSAMTLVVTCRGRGGDLVQQTYHRRRDVPSDLDAVIAQIEQQIGTLPGT